ncbi:MAG: hypothetical protein KGZ63_12775 [Clostridiales bacterium]|jgi:hypothetical protein|nr:hypothetical protein [Clostridiales bacterium]
MTQGWQLKNIYLYLVSFVTLMMIIFGLISFIHNLARASFPVDYSYYQTLMDIEREYTNNNREVPPVSELEQIRDERITSEQNRNRAYLLRDLIGSLTVWLIPIPFYIYHWRKIQYELFPRKGDIPA